MFYSKEFYDQTVLAESPLQLEEFVIQWMGTYYNISFFLMQFDPSYEEGTANQDIASDGSRNSSPDSMSRTIRRDESATTTVKLPHGKSSLSSKVNTNSV